MKNAGYGELRNYDLKEFFKKLRPHDHLCLLYEERDVWADTIVHFIHEGLKQNQKCIYVADENTAQEIRDTFNDKDIDISEYESTGQLVITSNRETYTKKGHFDPMIKLLISETEKAIEEGYNALRVTGEITPALHGIKGSEKILEYETKLNRDLFPNYPCAVMCQYDMQKFDPEIIKGVILAHPLVVKDGKIYRNFYYIQPEDLLNQKKSERQIKQWLDNLEREKQFLETIKNQKEEYETTFNSLNEGVILQKSTGEILSMNESAEKILRIKKENVVGKSSMDYEWNMIKENGEDFSPEEHPSIHTLKTGESCRNKVLGRENKDGSTTWINVNTNPIYRENSKTPDAVVISFSDITKRKKTAEELGQIKWMLNTRKYKHNEEYRTPQYGNLTELNKSGLILKSVGEDILKGIATDYLGLLETSTAIYEKNGDYALGIFSSGWCRFLDSSSRALCKTKDNRKALNSGKWLCHECCWNEAAKPAIITGKPTDIACEGGIRLYAVPIWANNKVIGAMNFGYGDPPKDEDTLNDIAKKYSVDINELKKKAEEYQKRPPFIIDLAKERLHSSARLIGTMVEKNQAMEELKAINTTLQLAYEGAGLGIWDHDFRTNKVVRTGKWAEMLGYKPEEIDEMLDVWKKLIHPEDKERVEKIIQKTDDGVTDEFKVVHR
ncbi:MAG: PAS domain S-box protein, partial [Kosmotoga sp.]